MTITEIRATAGRTLPHPHHSYANVRSEVTLVASLSAEDDRTECLKQLQLQAERSVEEHSALVVASLEERELLKREADDLRRLSQSIADNQQRLEQMQARQTERCSQTLMTF